MPNNEKLSNDEFFKSMERLNGNLFGRDGAFDLLKAKIESLETEMKQVVAQNQQLLEQNQVLAESVLALTSKVESLTQVVAPARTQTPEYEEMMSRFK